MPECRKTFSVKKACAELRCAAGRVVSIYTPAVEDAYVKNMYQRSKLDWLIDHDPAGYAQLVLHSALFESSPLKCPQHLCRHLLGSVIQCLKKGENDYG